MRTLTNGSLTVVAFDYNAYKQERNILRCTVSGTGITMSNVTVQLFRSATKIAAYNVTSAGKVDIDLTDYIRVYGSSALTVTAYNSASSIGSVSVSWSVVGLLPPKKLFVPDTPEAADIRSSVNIANNWVLPTKVIEPTTSADVLEVYGLTGAYLLKSTKTLSPQKWCMYIEGGISAEFYPQVQPVNVIKNIYLDVYHVTRTDEEIARWLVDAHDQTFQYTFADMTYPTREGAENDEGAIDECVSHLGYVDAWDLWATDTGGAYTTEKLVENSHETLTIDTTIKAIGVTDANKNIVQSVLIQPRLCGLLYAAVQWVSATGQTRRATWEAREHKQQTGESVAISAISDAFDIRKGREDALTLRLSGLTAFDVWYYGDIVTSSNVQISLDGGTTWQRVKVESKEVVVPDGDSGELQDLKIQITYAEYDAVVM